MSESPYITTCDVRAPLPRPAHRSPDPIHFAGVAAALRSRDGGLDVHDLARLSGVPLGLVRDVLAMLKAARFVRQIDLHGHDLWYVIPGASA